MIASPSDTPTLSAVACPDYDLERGGSTRML